MVVTACEVNALQYSAKAALFFAIRVVSPGRPMPIAVPSRAEISEAEQATEAAPFDLRPDSSTQMEKLIGVTLLAGVLLSTFVVLLGGLIYVSRHASMTTDYRVFRGEPSDLRSLSGIGKDVRAFSGRGIIQFGLVLLVALQVVRVALTGALFVLSRDRVFVVITSIVLALLAYGLIFEAAGAH
jgi:uncharacterized membrane protein